MHKLGNLARAALVASALAGAWPRGAAAEEDQASPAAATSPVTLDVDATLAVVSPAAPPPVRVASSLYRLELTSGIDTPLGMGGMSLVYAPLRWLSLGGGFGISDAPMGTVHTRYAVFARAHVLRRGPLVLGPVLTASLGDREDEETYQRPQYTPDHLSWAWKPAYRLDAGLGAELRWSRLVARIEGGLGVVLNRATCSYSTEATAFVGACDAPQIPSYYHFSRDPGSLAPYVSVTIGVDATDAATPMSEGNQGGQARATDARTDAAWAAPTALTQPKGSVTITVYELILPNLTVGVTDRVQVSAGLGRVFFGNGPTLWDASVKATLAALGPFHFALMAGAGGVKADLSSSLGFYGMGAGPVVSLCVDRGCTTVLSASALVGRVHIDPDEGLPRDELGVLVSPSVVLGVATHLKLVAEVHWVSRNSPDLPWVAALRVPYGPLAVDAGVLEGKVPLGSVSWRW